MGAWLLFAIPFLWSFTSTCRDRNAKLSGIGRPTTKGLWKKEEAGKPVSAVITRTLSFSSFQQSRGIRGGLVREGVDNKEVHSLQRI